MKNDIIVAIDKLTVKSSSVEYPIFTVKLRVTFTYIFFLHWNAGKIYKNPTRLQLYYSIKFSSKNVQ